MAITKQTLGFAIHKITQAWQYLGRPNTFTCGIHEVPKEYVDGKYEIIKVKDFEVAEIPLSKDRFGPHINLFLI